MAVAACLRHALARLIRIVDGVVAVTICTGGCLQVAIDDMLRMDAVSVALKDVAMTLLADLLHPNRKVAARFRVDGLVRKTP